MESMEPTDNPLPAILTPGTIRAMPSGVPDGAGDSLARATTGVAAMVEHLTAAARAESAVGPASTVGGRTLVPLASVMVTTGWGLGFGGGRGGSIEAGQNAQGSGSGGGSGGGGRASSRVIAIAEVSETGVKVKPVVDVTSLALGLMALIGIGFLSRRGAGRTAGRRLMGFFARS
jgi:uncharacterized spore protein YtfJ